MINWSKIKAVFFDMDGVLYDSMKNHEATWIASFQQYHIALPPFEAYLNEGRTGNATIDYIFKKYLNRPATRQEQEEVYTYTTRLMNQAPKAEIMPEMPALLSFLRAKQIATFVVTGSRQPSLIEKLKRDFEIESHQIVSGANVKKGKPDPEPYLMALQKSGFQLHECLVLENAPLGIESGKAAGLYTVGVNTGILEDTILWDAGADELFDDTTVLATQWMEALSHNR